MASPQSSLEASELRRRGRQRLIGAVVLVLLLVVFVPMLLDSQPRTSGDTPSLTIPPKDNAPPLPPPSAAPPQPVASAPAASPDAAKVETTAPAPKTEAPKAAAAMVQPATPAPKVAATSPAPAAATSTNVPPKEGFVVQVGAFRDEAKLKQARAKLEAAGVPHYIERLDSKSGALTRLRAGPFATREQAEAAQVAIKRAALEGKVMPLP